MKRQATSLGNRRNGLGWLVAITMALTVLGDAEAVAEVPALPLDEIIRDSRSVEALTAAFRDERVDHRAVVKMFRDADASAAIFPAFETLLLDHYLANRAAGRVRPQDWDDLLYLHKRLLQFESVNSVMFADFVKRVLLAHLQLWVMERPAEIPLARVQAVSDALRLEPAYLSLYMGPGPLDAEVPPLQPWDGNMEAVLPEFDRLREVGQQVLATHSARGFNPSMSDMLKTYQLLIEEQDMLRMAYEVLTTEAIRHSFLNATLEFLRREGDPEKVNVHDVRYFTEVMPHEVRRQYRFPFLGTSTFNARYLLDWIQGSRPGPLETDLPSYLYFTTVPAEQIMEAVIAADDEARARAGEDDDSTE